MGQRLTSTEKWWDPWFIELSKNSKLLFLYLTDNCDIAGFYERSDKIIIPCTELSKEEIDASTGELERSVMYSDGIYLLKNFIRHQKNLPINQDNHCHMGIVKRLIKYKDKMGQFYPQILDEDSLQTLSPLLGASKPQASSYSNSKGKGKGKEVFKPPTTEEIAEYCNERTNGVDPDKFYNFYQSKGWMVGRNKMKDWKACVRTWEKKDKGETFEHSL